MSHTALTTAELALALGVTVSQVRRLCAIYGVQPVTKGTVGRGLGSTWPPSAVEKLKGRRKAGNPMWVKGLRPN